MPKARKVAACRRFVVGDDVVIALPLRTVKTHVLGKTLYKAEIESIGARTMTVKRPNGRRAIVPCRYVNLTFGRTR